MGRDPSRLRELLKPRRGGLAWELEGREESGTCGPRTLRERRTSKEMGRASGFQSSSPAPWPQFIPSSQPASSPALRAPELPSHLPAGTPVTFTASVTQAATGKML